MQIYCEEFGEEISQEEAYSRFLRLINFLRVITKADFPSTENGNGDDISFRFDDCHKGGKIRQNLA